MFAVVPTRQMRLAPAATDDVSGALAALRAEVGLPAMFPQDVLEEARAAVENDFTAGRTDRRDIGFVTIDPPGSKDLDQAVHVEQSGEGYVVHYAIADVGAFVTPGGAIDAEVRRRGMTVYGPDARTPLHPKVLSEGAASLLPEEDRPAVLWTVTLDARGIITGASLERASVRSRERLTYAEVQSTLDAGTASESLQLLADVGRLRQSLEQARGGVSLSVPEQEVERREDGTYTLSFRRNLPVEEWNAQISLLTGIAAAHLMREAGVGILRTLPEADPRDLARLHRTARALGIDWPDSLPYARLVPTLVSRVPEHAAFLNEATTLFRGAGYVAFGMRGPDGAVVPTPESTRHAAIAADYAHVTAPLRRLVDRYATEICLAVSAGRPVPDWVLEALGDLPGVMAETGRRASSFERECVNIVEASLLADRLGEDFDGVVVDVDEPDEELQRGEVVLRDPAVRARVVGVALPLGEEVRVQLAEADVAGRRVTFTLGGPFSGRAEGAPGQPDRRAGSESGGPGVPGASDGAPERGGRRAARRASAGTDGGPAAPASFAGPAVAPASASFATPADGPHPAHSPLPAHGVVAEPGPVVAPGPVGQPGPVAGPGPEAFSQPRPELPSRAERAPRPEPAPQREVRPLSGLHAQAGPWRQPEPEARPEPPLRSRAQHHRRPEPVMSPDPWQQPEPSPSPQPRPVPRPRPTPQPRPTPEPRPEPQQAPPPPAFRPVTSEVPGRPAPDVPRRARRTDYPPMSRPVRPQVRDELPLSEPWPRRAPGGHPLSQPVPAVHTGGLPHVVQVARYPSSRELPVVVAADLLAVEGPTPDVYRY